jgi:hypothetical protein
MNDSHRPAGSLRVAEVVATFAVLRETTYRIAIPAGVKDDAIAAWAIAQAQAGALGLPRATRITRPPYEAQPEWRTTSISYRVDRADYQAPRTFKIDAEEGGSIALSFITAEELRLTVAGMRWAQTTYEWIRGGENGEHLAAIQDDGTIAFAAAGPSQPGWCHQFAAAAAAIGGCFTRVEIERDTPNTDSGRFAVFASAGNEENPDLHIDNVRAGEIATPAQITISGLQQALGATPLIAYDPKTQYWTLAERNYSDVTIAGP